ncbi:hypothetical protein B0H14DRAFT_2567484 [Mycena olivaceomarginata]|nr:hypothetical protein B0H14DRAFT_2567484 [Mycena olivaceomarginata]
MPFFFLTYSDISWDSTFQARIPKLGEADAGGAEFLLHRIDQVRGWVQRTVVHRETAKAVGAGAEPVGLQPAGIVHEEKRDRRRNQRDAESAGTGSCRPALILSGSGIRNYCEPAGGRGERDGRSQDPFLAHLIDLCERVGGQGPWVEQVGAGGAGASGSRVRHGWRCKQQALKSGGEAVREERGGGSGFRGKGGGAGDWELWMWQLLMRTKRECAHQSDRFDANQVHRSCAHQAD